MTEHDPEISRRRLFARITYVCGATVALLAGLPLVGFIFAPMFRRLPRVWRDVGALDDFEIGPTTKVEFEDPSPLPWAGVTGRTAAWLRRTEQQRFIAFSVNCRHLGCPVKWVAGAELFMCPCHGGVYYRDGSVAAGPPPEGLATYAVRVVNGRVEIQTGPIPLPVDPSGSQHGDAPT